MNALEIIVTWIGIYFVIPWLVVTAIATVHWCYMKLRHGDQWDERIW